MKESYLIILILVPLVCLILLYIFFKLDKNQQVKNGGVRLVSSLGVGLKQRIIIVRVENTDYIIGQTSNTLSLIDKVIRREENKKATEEND